MNTTETKPPASNEASLNVTPLRTAGEIAAGKATPPVHEVPPLIGALAAGRLELDLKAMDAILNFRTDAPDYREKLIDYLVSLDLFPPLFPGGWPDRGAAGQLVDWLNARKNGAKSDPAIEEYFAGQAELVRVLNKANAAREKAHAAARELERLNSVVKTAEQHLVDENHRLAEFVAELEFREEGPAAGQHANTIEYHAEWFSRLVSAREAVRWYQEKGIPQLERRLADARAALSAFEQRPNA